MATAQHSDTESNSQHGDSKISRYSRGKEIAILIGALLASSLLAVGVYFIWHYEREHPTTEDAFLRAHYVWIKPQVPGQVVEIFVSPNQFVRAGDPLFQIDPRLYQEHLLKAEQELVLVQQQIEADKAIVSAAKARVSEQEAAVGTAQQYADRYNEMVKKGAASELRTIGYENALVVAKGKLLEAKQDLQKAIIELGDDDVRRARVEKAQAEVKLAKLNLEWTLIKAPADGLVSQFELRAGDVVRPGDRLFPFIETDVWWVQANFKETELKKVRPGMPVTVTVDLYGGRTFKGVVESLSGSSAAIFSLLPAQNTTGNWVKVTQRIPVRIRMLEQDPKHPFRMGASVQATVDTKAPLIEQYAHPELHATPLQ